MLLKQPYFMDNKDWYYHDKKTNRYKLTDKAPKEAIKSYDEFYAELDKPDPGLYNSLMSEFIERMRNDLRQKGKSEAEIEKEVNEWRSRFN